LDQQPVVIGPTTDGGYYLLGMKAENQSLFQNKDWGTSTVYDDTVSDLEQQGVTYAILTKLNDVDTIDDLMQTDILSKIKEEINDENSEGLLS
jgi:glycosyltransferase A (GT-A) superfamily protein (DUF2064 family)